MSPPALRAFGAGRYNSAKRLIQRGDEMTTINRPVLSGVRSVLLDTAVVGGIAVFLAVMVATGRPGQLGELVQENMRNSFAFFVSLQFLLAVPVIFAIEHFFPARPEQRGFSPSIAFDSLYMLIHLPVIISFLVWTSGPIETFLDENLSFLVVDSTRSWPLPLMAILGIALHDLGVWAAHITKHKVPLFWRFHMIHHSQTRMNMFTANRTHPIDALIDGFFLLLPLYFLFPSLTAEAGSIFIIAIGPAWWARFQHANIRTNLGPLRWLIVTPQSHRVHHSTEPEHWNSNYANIFAWDRLFGTQHSDVTSYPPTGINDQYFPEPERVSPAAFASSFVGQMLFPFDAAAVKRASTGSPHDNPVVGDR